MKEKVLQVSDFTFSHIVKTEGLDNHLKTTKQRNNK